METPSAAVARTRIVLAQCTGMLPHVFITNNHLLLYLLALGLQESGSLVVLGLLAAVQSLLILPLSVACERRGRKQVGFPGTVLAAAGFAVFVVLPLLPEAWRAPMVFVGAIAHAVGNAMHRAGWFPLIDAVVEPERRGRFFGRMRFAFMAVGLVFSLAVGAALDRSTSVPVFQGFTMLLALALVARIAFYAGIPDRGSTPVDSPHGSLAALAAPLLRDRRFLAFNAYVFLVTLVTDGALALFGLVEKRVLGFEDGMTAQLGNATLAGMLVGFMLAGVAVDRFGSRVVTIAVHAAYVVSIGGFLLAARGDEAADPFMLAACHVLYGLARAGFSIVFTRDMLMLIPAEAKSVSTTVTTTMATLGGSLSLVVPGLLGGDLGAGAAQGWLLAMALGALLTLALPRARGWWSRP